MDLLLEFSTECNKLCICRVARRQSHKLRQRIHKNRMPETLNEEKKYVYAEGGSKGIIWPSLAMPRTLYS